MTREFIDSPIVQDHTDKLLDTARLWIGNTLSNSLKTSA